MVDVGVGAVAHVIDFRYFLVSLTGVFLALAVGVALGAGPFRGELDDQLRSDLRQVGREKDDLRGRIHKLQQVDRYRDTFAKDLAPNLVHGRLANQEIVLVALPGADTAMVKDVGNIVTAAGGAVTGTVRVQPKWADPGERQFLEDLAGRLVTGTTAASAGSAYERAGSVLAGALVTEDDRAAGRRDSTTATVVGAFGEGGLVDAPAALPRARFAVVIAPPATSRPGGQGATTADISSEGAADGSGPDGTAAVGEPWVELARALDDAGRGVVMAGEVSAAAGERGALASLRNDSRASDSVSTVDVADLPSGQVAIVWALAEQSEGGAGHYGAVGTTDGALPTSP
jgi:hypothetical protein